MSTTVKATARNLEALAGTVWVRVGARPHPMVPNADHWLFTYDPPFACPGCGGPLVSGDAVTLIAEPETQSGNNILAGIWHWDCRPDEEVPA